MRVEMRVYRQFDLDLYALAAAGYSLSRLFETAVTSFANGNPVYIIIDELNNFSIGDKTAFLHFCFKVDNRDTATVNLLQSAAPRMRTSLCKMILRNALGQQDLRCFFPDYPEIDRLMMIDANKRLLMSRPDTVPISRFKVQTNLKDYAGIQIDMGVKEQGTKRNFDGYTSAQTGIYSGYQTQPQYKAPVRQQYAAPQSNPYMPVQEEQLQQPYVMQPRTQQSQQMAGMYRENTMPTNDNMRQQSETNRQTTRPADSPANVIQEPAYKTQPASFGMTPAADVKHMQTTQPVNNIQNAQDVHNIQNTQIQGVQTQPDPVPTDTSPADEKPPATVSDDLLNAFDNL